MNGSQHNFSYSYLEFTPNNMEESKTSGFILKIVLSCVVGIVSLNCVTAKLSDHITLCSAKDPAIEKCLITQGQKLFAEMEKGIPEFDIKPVDPMAVPRLGIQRTDLGMSLVLTNSTHRGISQATINKAKADFKNHYFEFALSVPTYTISGHYDVNGKVMLLPITGKGDSNITLYDVDALWMIKGELVDKNNKKYLELRSFNVTIQPKNMRVRFENLFNGNEVLGQTMNQLLNNNWKDVFRQIKPPLEKSYGELLFAFANKIFSRTPYNELFKDV